MNVETIIEQANKRQLAVGRASSLTDQVAILVGTASNYNLPVTFHDFDTATVFGYKYNFNHVTHQWEEE